MTDLATLHERLEHVPIMKPYRGEFLYDFVKRHRFDSCLELGFAMGASAGYIAGALDEIGAGHLTAVDREDAPFEQPNIEVVLADLDLEPYVTWCGSNAATRGSSNASSRGPTIPATTSCSSTADTPGMPTDSRFFSSIACCAPGGGCCSTTSSGHFAAAPRNVMPRTS